MKRLIICVIVVISLFVAWFFWPHHSSPLSLDDSEIADAVVQISDTDIADRVDISDDLVVSISFLPKIPWPDDESIIVVISIVPDGMPYSAAKSCGMFRATRKGSVSLGVTKNGIARQFSPPSPAPGDPRCHYYGVLSRREIVFDGPCRLEVMLAKVSTAKTGNYGQFSPMSMTCIYRRNVEITR